MKNYLFAPLILFISTLEAMSYGSSTFENILLSKDTRLVPYFPAHVRMVRLVNGEDRTDEAHMPSFFYRETILAAYTAHPPTPARIAYLAAHYQATHQLPDGTIRHDDGSINSSAEFEQAIKQTLQEAEAIKQQKEDIARQDPVKAIEQQQQEVAEGKDRVSRVLTVTRIPLLLAGGAITAASIMRAAAHRSSTRFLSLTTLTELPKGVYAILLAGMAAKYVWGAACNKWLSWTRDRAITAVKELRPRIEKLEEAEREKGRELKQLRENFAAYQQAESMRQKIEQEERERQECAIKAMIDALRSYLQKQLDALRQQVVQETQTGESAHQQLRQELTDMQESLGRLRVSGQHQTETLIQIQKACAQVETIASKFKKR